MKRGSEEALAKAIAPDSGQVLALVENLDNLDLLVD
jgi:hypothetical protein